jgi:hypothetical protein
VARTASATPHFPANTGNNTDRGAVLHGNGNSLDRTGRFRPRLCREASSVTFPRKSFRAIPLRSVESFFLPGLAAFGGQLRVGRMDPNCSAAAGGLVS